MNEPTSDAVTWEEVNEARKELLQHRRELDELLSSLDPQIKEETFSISDQVDIGWALREMMTAYDEMRKDCKARMQLIGKVIALRWTDRCLANPELANVNPSGTHANAIPDLKQTPRMPRRDSPEYYQLCRTLGFTDEKLMGLGVVQFHFGRMTEWVSQIVEDGKPLPSGIPGTIPQYKTTFRTRKKPSNGDS